MESGEKILAWLEEGKDVRFGEWGVRWGRRQGAAGQPGPQLPAGAGRLARAASNRDAIPRPAAALPPLTLPAFPPPAPHLRDVDVLNTMQLLTAKPAVYLVNLTEKDYQRKKNKWLPKIFEWVQVGACI
jgi:hypothetical protein